jgi:hypothetical protein
MEKKVVRDAEVVVEVDEAAVKQKSTKSDSANAGIPFRVK